MGSVRSTQDFTRILLGAGMEACPTLSGIFFVFDSVHDL